METNQKKIHILLIPSWYLPEGGQFCRNQAQLLCERGIKVNILANVSISWKKYGLKSLTFPWFSFTSKEDGLLVFRKFSLRIPRLKALNGILWSWQTVKMFDKYVKENGQPDLTHAHSVLWGGYAAYLIYKKRGVPYVITEHKGIFGESCRYAKNQFENWQTPYMERAFTNAKVIIPVSTKLIPKIKTYLTKEVNIQQISNVVDTDFFYYKERIIDSEIKLVAVNGFMHVKAYDILLPAFDKACDQLSNLTLRIVGEDFEGVEFEKLWATIKYKDKITFTGELDMYGVRDELWNANIFAISSRVESQSVSALEAMSTGLPMVCTTVIPSEMANEKTAITAAVENIESFTKAIIDMCVKFEQFDSKQISRNTKRIAGKEIISAKLIELYSKNA